MIKTSKLVAAINLLHFVINIIQKPSYDKIYKPQTIE